MKKITYFVFSCIILIFLSDCSGYKPIFGSGNLKFKISNYSIEGNKILGNKIYSRLNSLSKSNKNNKNVRSIDLFIKTTKDKTPTSKNSAGKILEYKITLNTEVKVKDFITDDYILNQIFISSVTYKTQKYYGDTIKLEDQSLDNLVNKTYQELINRLTQNITAN